MDRKILSGRFSESLHVVTSQLTSWLKDKLSALDESFDYGIDLKRFTTDLLECFRTLLLVKMGDCQELIELPAEEIALIYKLRWEIETFFAWWKRHLRVYHLIARSEHGLWYKSYQG